MNKLCMTVNPMTSFIALTAAERAVGRVMRAPDHPASSAPPAPAAAPAPPAAPAMSGVSDTGDSDMDNFISEEVDDGRAAAPKPKEAKAKAPAKEGEEEQDSGKGPTPAPGEKDEAPGSEEGAEGEEGEDDPKKPKSDVQKRMDQMTAARREADAKAAEAGRQAEYWRGVAEGRTPKAQPGAEEKGPAEDLEPDAKDYKYGETDTDYIRDLASFEGRKAVQSEQRRIKIEGQIEALEKGFDERSEAAKTVYTDYDDKVVKGADRGDWSCSQIMTLGIKSSDVGPHIAYHLASNPEESDRIARLSPLEQAKEIGRLEFRFETEAKAKADAAEAAAKEAGAEEEQPEKKQPKTVSEAPPPPEHRARGGGGKFDTPADTEDFRAFDRRADEVIAKRQRR